MHPLAEMNIPFSLPFYSMFCLSFFFHHARESTGQLFTKDCRQPRHTGRACLAPSYARRFLCPRERFPKKAVARDVVAALRPCKVSC